MHQRIKIGTSIALLFSVYFASWQRWISVSRCIFRSYYVILPTCWINCKKTITRYFICWNRQDRNARNLFRFFLPTFLFPSSPFLSFPLPRSGLLKWRYGGISSPNGFEAEPQLQTHFSCIESPGNASDAAQCSTKHDFQDLHGSMETLFRLRAKHFYVLQYSHGYKYQ